VIYNKNVLKYVSLVPSIYPDPLVVTPPPPPYSLLVVVEDVDGAGRRHEPHEPAHVSRQRAELTQVQPDRTKDTSQASITTSDPPPLTPPPHRVRCSPRRVGGGDEEVDDHAVTHVEALLHGPETHTNRSSINLPVFICICWYFCLGSNLIFLYSHL